MTLTECYKKIDANYDEVIERLLTEDRVQKYTLRFLTIPDFENLKQAHGAGDFELMQRHSHTLKGIALNLSFKNLAEKSAKMKDVIAAGSRDKAETDLLYSEIETEYNKVISIIQEYKDSL